MGLTEHQQLLALSTVGHFLVAAKDLAVGQQLQRFQKVERDSDSVCSLTSGRDNSPSDSPEPPTAALMTLDKWRWESHFSVTA